MMLEKATTTITAKAITKAGLNCTVIANAEQIPNTCTVIGLLSLNGSDNNLHRYLRRKDNTVGSAKFKYEIDLSLI